MTRFCVPTVQLNFIRNAGQARYLKQKTLQILLKLQSCIELNQAGIQALQDLLKYQQF